MSATNSQRAKKKPALRIWHNGSPTQGHHWYHYVLLGAASGSVTMKGIPMLVQQALEWSRK